MTGIRKVRRLRETVDYPEQTPLVGNHDVCVFVVSERRRNAVDDLANVPVDKHAAFTCHIVRERQLGKVANAPGQQQAPQTVTNSYPADSFVSRGGVCIALGIVKLL